MASSALCTKELFDSLVKEKPKAGAAHIHICLAASG
jgi:hypothetical protein